VERPALDQTSPKRAYREPTWSLLRARTQRPRRTERTDTNTSNAHKSHVPGLPGTSRGWSGGTAAFTPAPCLHSVVDCPVDRVWVSVNPGRTSACSAMNATLTRGQCPRTTSMVRRLANSHSHTRSGAASSSGSLVAQPSSHQWRTAAAPGPDRHRTGSGRGAGGGRRRVRRTTPRARNSGSGRIFRVRPLGQEGEARLVSALRLVCIKERVPSERLGRWQPHGARLAPTT
jgi:hypothetical protein